MCEFVRAEEVLDNNVWRATYSFRGREIHRPVYRFHTQAHELLCADLDVSVMLLTEADDYGIAAALDDIDCMDPRERAHTTAVIEEYREWLGSEMWAEVVEHWSPSEWNGYECASLAWEEWIGSLCSSWEGESIPPCAQ